MKDFKNYWDKIAQKRRKTWKSKLDRKIEKHLDAKRVREDVFIAFKDTIGFSYESYKTAHFTQKNPFVEWEQGVMRFSESGLKKALQQQGANLKEFKMESSRATDNGTLLPDVEIITINYGKAVMTIKRFSAQGIPFGCYEIVPTTQLATGLPWKMEETGFYTLDIATLLMEMDAELNLRDEELSYYLKGMRLTTMEGVTADKLEYKLWTEEEIPVKVRSYLKRYSYWDEESIMKTAIRPWMDAVRKAMEAITEADKNKEDLIFSIWEKNPRTWYYVKSEQEMEEEYFEKVFCQYLYNQGLQDAKVGFYNGNTYIIAIEYKGCPILLQDHRLHPQAPCQCHLYPIFYNMTVKSDRQDYNIKFSMLSLSAIAWYIKQAPEHKDRILRYKEQVLAAYMTCKGIEQ